MPCRADLIGICTMMWCRFLHALCKFPLNGATLSAAVLFIVHKNSQISYHKQNITVMRNLYEKNAH